MDVVLSRTSQAERFSSELTKKILDEIRNISKSAKKIIISGGEPFLSKYLVDIVNENSHVPQIKIFTGLGVDRKRFERILDVLSEKKNVILAISAESVGDLYEFNRYGMRWDDFLEKVKLLTDKNIQFGFSSVISNLTVSRFADFYSWFGNRYIQIECVYNPNFLAPHILDQETKASVIEQIQQISFAERQIIMDSLVSNPSEQEQQDLKQFLKTFVERRPGLSLNSLPRTFVDWINHVV
jgi:organic radical activating enzyme